LGFQKLELAGTDLGHVQQIADDGQKMQAGAVNVGAMGAIGGRALCVGSNRSP
jgi:ABC-type phosphonate transport system ATPase subunit